MSESSLSVEAVGGPCFSLTRAVRAVLRANGHDANFDDLHAAMGLSFLTVAAVEEQDVALWSCYARDAFLIEIAGQFGMVVRPVHPPEAVRGLEGAREFRQHFAASYRPIIVRALEHGQPVLAWRGWSNELDASWGTITGTCTEGIGLSGTVFATTEGGGIAATVLVRPAVQFYVIESIDLVVPSPSDLLAGATNRVARALDGALDELFGVVTGPRACDEWLARIRRDASTEDEYPTTASSHRRLALDILAEHESGLRFLKRRRCDALPAWRETIDLSIAGAECVAAAVRRIAELEPAAPLDSDDLTAAILAAQRGASELREAVSTHR